MVNILQIVGFTGTLLVAIAYIPQISHMIGKRCAMGLDTKAWLIWAVATILVLIYAISTKEPIFITLTTLNLTAILIIFVLKMKYGNTMCGNHIIKLSPK